MSNTIYAVVMTYLDSGELAEESEDNVMFFSSLAEARKYAEEESVVGGEAQNAIVFEFHSTYKLPEKPKGIWTTSL